MREEKFKFDLYDRVSTPLVSEGIVSMLGVDEGGRTYYICNNVNGVAERWWAEDQLAKVE